MEKSILILLEKKWNGAILFKMLHQVGFTIFTPKVIEKIKIHLD